MVNVKDVDDNPFAIKLYSFNMYSYNIIYMKKFNASYNRFKPVDDVISVLCNA